MDLVFFYVCVCGGGGVTRDEGDEGAQGWRLKVEDGGSKDGKRRGSERFLFLWGWRPCVGKMKGYKRGGGQVSVLCFF